MTELERLTTEFNALSFEERAQLLKQLQGNEEWAHARSARPPEKGKLPAKEKSLRKRWFVSKIEFSVGDYIAIISLLVGFIVTIATLVVTVNQFKQARTAAYIERINNPDMSTVRSQIDGWLDGQYKSDAEKLQVLEADKSLKSSLRTFLNIITEMGISYRYGLIDREMTNEMWNPLITDYWERLQFYVYGSRLNGKKVGYYFEYLAKEIRTYDTEHTKEIANRYHVPTHYTVNNESHETKLLAPVKETPAQLRATPAPVQGATTPNP